MIHAQGAGTYGHNGSDDAAIDAAVIAVRRPGRPIRVQWRREDEFGHEPLGTAMHIELTAELDAAGTPGRLHDRDLERLAHRRPRPLPGRDARWACRRRRRMAPPNLPGRRALQRRHPQRHAVLRHRRASG